jgi:tetratricopeptide (TPR) repeat protein
MQYKKRQETAQQIAEELGVDYILEGTIQRERPSEPASRVRIIPQLIRASDDVHVWAQVYDDDMSEIFRLQSDLAERIAQALDITLLEPERQMLRTEPTESMEAYEYYFRGNEYFQRSYLQDDIRIAIRMYEKAVELDPAFVLAHTRLSLAHVDMYWYHYDRSEQRLAMAKKAVDEASRLSSNLPEVQLWGGIITMVIWISVVPWSTSQRLVRVSQTTASSRKVLLVFKGDEESSGRHWQTSRKLPSLIRVPTLWFLRSRIPVCSCACTQKQSLITSVPSR